MLPFYPTGIPLEDLGSSSDLHPLLHHRRGLIPDQAENRSVLGDQDRLRTVKIGLFPGFGRAEEPRAEFPPGGFSGR